MIEDEGFGAGFWEAGNGLSNYYNFMWGAVGLWICNLIKMCFILITYNIWKNKM
jgi:hypothetical protein